ncbi:MAG TPA: hypothetical protein VIV40_36850 [Kofleriaceae bacterium]
MTLASFELGPAATPDARAPVIAKHKAACESTHVTADEASCLFSAKDTWTARACLPRMFPAKPPPAGADVTGCSTVAERMRAAVMTEVGSNGSAAEAQLAKILPIIQAGCIEDEWPKPVVKCIVDTKPGDMQAFQNCANQLPKPQQDKLSQRLGVQPPAADPQPPAPSQPPAPK